MVYLSKNSSLFRTLRDSQSEAEIASHQLLLRAGYIRQVSSGLYHYLPLAFRVLSKIKNIIRSHMLSVEGMELLMPSLQPSSLWEKSGRWDQMGKELLRVSDRLGRSYALSPTHEEIVTDLLDSMDLSYKNLPAHFFQMQTKFRDEVRPRFGLMRAKEFIMKDGYSFHANEDCLKDYFRRMSQVYHEIFRNCGLETIAVEADSGLIGGGVSQEFMYLSNCGQDKVVQCLSCQSFMNIEKASVFVPECLAGMERKEELFCQNTGSAASIEDLLKFFPDFSHSQLIKTLIYEVDDQLVALAFPSNRDINEAKLKSFLNANVCQLADRSVFDQYQIPLGYIGPFQWDQKDIPLYVDRTVLLKDDVICGANKEFFHWVHLSPSQDLDASSFSWSDFTSPLVGDACSLCRVGTYDIQEGTEVGHIFQLGQKYSSRLSSTFKDECGKEKEFVMGCYGIGVSRLMSTIVEGHHDARGIIWPFSVTPYDVLLIVLAKDISLIQSDVEMIQKDLESIGLSVLIDDRKMGFGAKFCDADLIGIPLHVIVSECLLKDSSVELKDRCAQKAHVVERVRWLEEFQKLRDSLIEKS